MPKDTMRYPVRAAPRARTCGPEHPARQSRSGRPVPEARVHPARFFCERTEAPELGVEPEGKLQTVTNLSAQGTDPDQRKFVPSGHE